jgi:hypothetical protein
MCSEVQIKALIAQQEVQLSQAVEGEKQVSGRFAPRSAAGRSIVVFLLFAEAQRCSPTAVGREESAQDRQQSSAGMQRGVVGLSLGSADSVPLGSLR